MSGEWKPGDVAVAVSASRGLCLVRRRAMSDHYPWLVLDELGGPVSESNLTRVEPIGPLVVIDPEDREQVERLAGLLCDSSVLAVANALREFANPQPPKPDEPTGLGAVVEDADGFAWIRTADDRAGAPWSRRNLPGIQQTREWSEITAVRVLSEGVRP